MFPKEYWYIVLYSDNEVPETVLDCYYSSDVAISLCQFLARKFIIDGVDFRFLRVFHIKSDRHECNGDLVFTLDPRHLRSDR